MGNIQQRKLRYVVLVFLYVTSTPPAADGQIRLAGSGSPRCAGRVEIYHNNIWGTVCDDYWDLTDAGVVCRQMHCGTALSASQSAHFGAGTGQIWLDDVGCSGSESSLTECRHNGFGKHNCGHSEDAGVVCSGVQIRLAGSGSTRCAGRVEIYHNNIWGTVCDDSWDLTDAGVVCRQMHCGPALSASQSAHFGAGTGQIWLDDVGCSGRESSLTECQHNGFGKHNCDHSEDAGVVCSAILPKPSISMNPVGEVTWGQDVSITCSISTQHLGGTFILQQTSGSFRKTQRSSTNSATFNITQVDFNNEGSYHCQYQTTVSSRDFSSPSSDSVRLSVAVSLPKPSISMNPVGEVTWGQDVSITCSISTQHLGGTFILQQTSDSFRKTQRSSTNSATFNITQVDFNNEGSYQCQYQTTVSSRDFSSPSSDSVRLSVAVSLPKPSISMNPVGEVTWGQDVSITCSISTQHLGGTFILQQTSGSFRKTQRSSTNSATFNIVQVDFNNEGSYQCQYQTTVSSQDFSSPSSDSVRLSVAVPLQQPSISLTSPNRGLVWSPEGAEVTRGYSFIFTCTTSSFYPGGVLSLIFSDSITDTKPAVNYSASFIFPVAEYEHQGNYSCVYDVTLSSRRFSSAQTAPITVTIKTSLLPLVSSVAAGGLLLLLLVLIVVCLVYKRRQQPKRPEALVQTQMALRVRNEYGVDEDEDEDDDYQNVDPMDTKRKLRDGAGRVEEESNDYEEPESDDDHNYEEAGPNANFIEAKKVCCSVEESRGEEEEEEDEEEEEEDEEEEDEEDTSDDENLYENITQPFDEQTVDIYEEDEDIYQNF